MMLTVKCVVVRDDDCVVRWDTSALSVSPGHKRSSVFLCQYSLEYAMLFVIQYTLLRPCLYNTFLKSMLNLILSQS